MPPAAGRARPLRDGIGEAGPREKFTELEGGVGQRGRGSDAPKCATRLRAGVAGGRRRGGQGSDPRGRRGDPRRHREAKASGDSYSHPISILHRSVFSVWGSAPRWYDGDADRVVGYPASRKKEDEGALPFSERESVQQSRSSPNFRSFNFIDAKIHVPLFMLLQK